MGRGCWDKRYSLEILSTKTKAGGGFPSYDMIFYGVPLCHSESMGDDCHYEYWIMTTHENFTAFVRTKITSPEPDPYRYDVTLIDEDVDTRDKDIIELSGEINSQCVLYMNLYARLKLNSKLLSFDEKIELIIAYYLNDSIIDPLDKWNLVDRRGTGSIIDTEYIVETIYNDIKESIDDTRPEKLRVAAEKINQFGEPQGIVKEIVEMFKLA